mmetsp:Transcript_60790/g.54781  ORF Transcript_60790/g.54781 Transcript_60790/m.54781 type:complete len:378 (+) Transcript_60790:307-1440(+)
MGNDHSQNRRKFSDYYINGERIGSGTFATVKRCTRKSDKKEFAVKIIDKRHLTGRELVGLKDEIRILKSMEFPHVISMIDVFDDGRRVKMVLELCEGGDLFDQILKSPKRHFEEAKCARITAIIARSLKYLHDHYVVHRDLKPENILINGADCNVKITDFGLARGVCKDENIEKPTEYVVTRWYRSPEVMCSAGFYDESVDIWSLGCIFAELILRRPLFPGQNYLDQLKIIFEVMGTPKDLTWIKTPEAKRWVQKLKPHNGKSLKQVFEKASDGALELLGVMLTMDPNHRYSALQCLRHPYLKELHRNEDESTCPPFDLSFEFEKAIKTKFGVRHMMYDALTEFQRNNPQKAKPQKSQPSKSSKRSKSSKDDQKNDK